MQRRLFAVLLVFGIASPALAQSRDAQRWLDECRRGRFSGYRSEWKKAYVKLKAGQKVPDFTEI